MTTWTTPGASSLVRASVLGFSGRSARQPTQTARRFESAQANVCRICKAEDGSINAFEGLTYPRPYLDRHCAEAVTTGQVELFADAVADVALRTVQDLRARTSIESTAQQGHR